jgi:hypothetical protein
MEEIRSKIKKILEAKKIETKKLSLLAGDASNRKYFQYFSSKKNYVIMYDNDEKSLNDFIKVTEILKKFVVVPSIIYDFSKYNILVLENFGPTKYAEIITKKNRKKVYRLAVDTIFDIQKIKNPKLSKYSLNMFVKESNLFFDWYLNYLNKKEVNVLKKKFNLLFKSHFYYIEDIPQVLVHRDFHIDNLFYLSKPKSIKCGLIDYQDAVIGPCAYDLVSLTQDARIDVPKKLEHELINYFLKGNLKIKRKDFMISYNLLAIQRHMKVLGIFNRLSLRDNKDQYLQHLPRVKTMLCENLKKEKFEEFNSLLSPLLSYVRH